MRDENLAERSSLVESICQRALDVPPSDRSAFLVSACRGDEELRREVESLLAYERSAEHFLAVPIVTLLPTGGDPPQLLIGRRIGPFEITSRLGAGGMGEVYRARDARLKRDVALKILPPSFAADADRIARFQREAEVLAALDHPHIAAIHGVEQDDGVRALVLQLVDGETLAERIARGPIRVEDAIGIATQIADALDAAHQQGFVHRDLKPANIKLTPQNVVKVLDFGLAKLSDRESPTFASPPTGTQPGLILGTASYMAPEQARGGPTDKRADIWAFGCVLYEMLTGTRAFAGDDLAETLTLVIDREPDWTRLPANVPDIVRTVLQRCLQKNPHERLRDSGDVRWLLLNPARAKAGHAPARRPWLAWTAAAAIAVVAIAGALRIRTGNTGPQPVTLTIALPPSVTLGADPLAQEISPDGKSVVYMRFDGRRDQLYVRRLESLDEMPLAAEALSGPPFWSPDSTRVAYPTRSGLFVVRLPDGAPELITPFEPFRTAFPVGASWSDSGTVVVNLQNDATSWSWPNVLLFVPASGRKAIPLTLATPRVGRYLNPEFLPGSDDLLFLFVPADGADPEVHLGTVRDGALTDTSLLLKNDTAARYTPAGGGRLLFVRNSDLYAQRLDRRSRMLKGEPELIARDVASIPSITMYRAAFSVARNGTLVWRPGKARFSQVTIFDRRGNRVGTAGVPSPINSIRLSPDETRVLAFSPLRAWIMQVGQPGRLSLPAGVQWFGWSPGGQDALGIQGQLVPDGTPPRLVARAADGPGELRVVGDFGDAAPGFPHDVGQDGLTVVTGDSSGRTLLSHAAAFAEKRVPRPLIGTDERVFNTRFSPDGRWVVYQPADGGLYVQPVHGSGRRRQIAPIAQYPEWRADGKEIVYRVPDSIWSISVRVAGDDLEFGIPQRLFGGIRLAAGSIGASRPLAVSADGSRFFWPLPNDEIATVLHVKIGWPGATF